MNTRTAVEPNIRHRNNLISLTVSHIDEEPAIDHALIQGSLRAGTQLRNGTIEHSIFDGVVAIEAIADGVIMRHISMNQCDWSNGSLEASSLATTVMNGCKFTGTRFNGGRLNDVRFYECQGEFSQFQYARFARVTFDGCNLKHAFFNGATLPGTVFEQCDLTEADFSRANLEGCDLRRSRLEGIRIAPEQLRGVIVTSDQALYLAGALGLDIRD